MSKKKIFVAGHNGMVGSALVRLLKLQDVKLITKDRKKLDLLNLILSVHWELLALFEFYILQIDLEKIKVKNLIIKYERYCKS